MAEMDEISAWKKEKETQIRKYSAASASTCPVRFIIRMRETANRDRTPPTRRLSAKLQSMAVKAASDA